MDRRDYHGVDHPALAHERLAGQRTSVVTWLADRWHQWRRARCSLFHQRHHVYDHIYALRIQRRICKRCDVMTDKPMSLPQRIRDLETQR
jgi:hypothetical protein